METRSEQNFIEDPDYVPLSIKVIVAWLYLYALVNFLGAPSFSEGRINIDLPSAVVGFLSIWSAHNLGYKRNYARVGAMVVAGWWFVTCLLFAWVMLENWQKIIESNAEFSMNFLGQSFPGILAIVCFFLVTGMNVYTFAILLQPYIREMFSSREQMVSEQ